MLNGRFFLKKNMASGGCFYTLRPPLLIFAGLKSSHILIIISMEKDGVFKKSLLHSFRKDFFGYPVDVYSHPW